MPPDRPVLPWPLAWPAAAGSLAAVYAGVAVVPGAIAGLAAVRGGMTASLGTAALGATLVVAGLVALVGVVRYARRPADGRIVLALAAATLPWLPGALLGFSAFQSAPAVARVVSAEPYRAATLLCLGVGILTFRVRLAERRDDLAPAERRGDPGLEEGAELQDDPVPEGDR